MALQETLQARSSLLLHTCLSPRTSSTQAATPRCQTNAQGQKQQAQQAASPHAGLTRVPRQGMLGLTGPQAPRHPSSGLQDSPAAPLLHPQPSPSSTLLQLPCPPPPSVQWAGRASTLSRQHSCPRMELLAPLPPQPSALRAGHAEALSSLQLSRLTEPRLLRQPGKHWAGHTSMLQFLRAPWPGLLCCPKAPGGPEAGHARGRWRVTASRLPRGSRQLPPGLSPAGVDCSS